MSSNKMQDVILGRKASARQGSEEVDRFVEGVVKKVTPEGLFFTVPEWDENVHLFGPAPWPKSRVDPTDSGSGLHDHEETEPPKGSRCVVLFLGAGVDRPWVLGWWS